MVKHYIAVEIQKQVKDVGIIAISTKLSIVKKAIVKLIKDAMYESASIEETKELHKKWELDKKDIIKTVNDMKISEIYWDLVDNYSNYIVITTHNKNIV